MEVNQIVAQIIEGAIAGAAYSAYGWKKNGGDLSFIKLIAAIIIGSLVGATGKALGMDYTQAHSLVALFVATPMVETTLKGLYNKYIAGFVEG